MPKKELPIKNDDLIVVGIGSSAGGIEALTKFISNIPKEKHNIAYVIVQHLSPTYKSMLREILAKETPLDVLVIKDGMVPKPNTIYIAPPDRDVVLKDGLLRLEKPPENRIGPKPSIDKFFISLANEKGDKAVGVILSGTGSDGAHGIRAIKAAGGIAIAQDPKDAKYDGMPLAAIQTKSVDYILKAEDIPKEIIRLIEYPKSVKVEEKENEDVLQAIFDILKEHTGIDFSYYKRSTILRRIERRMAAVKAVSLKDYLEYLKEHPEEVELLYKDMLIGVTAFFRDPDAFEALKRELKHYLDEHKDQEEIRVWVAACSTGEEAYSIAIIFDEIMDANDNRHLKIFATDIDEEAIKKAREGVYPETSLTNLTPEQIKRYFIQHGDMFEVKPRLKEKIIFSKHDLISDPPFINLDLISCRNVLIYFKPELQEKIFAKFAYALKYGGLLFLGKSENIGKHTDWFAIIDAKAKIFQCRVTPEEKKVLYSKMVDTSFFLKTPPKKKETTGKSSFEDAIKTSIIKYYKGGCVIIDPDFNIHYTKGDLQDILKIPEGQMRPSILKMLPSDLALIVRSLMYKAVREENIKFPLEEQKIIEDKLIKIKLFPLESYEGKEHYFVVCFEKDESDKVKLLKGPQSESEKDAYIKYLEQELMTTKEHLQTVIEELETSNEELQATNEELQASNEELQAANEELETTNEELQATNEELQNAYAEIKALYEKQKLQKEYLQNKLMEISRLKEKLALQYNYLKTILDKEKNIVIVTDGDKVLSANEQFFKFFSKYKNKTEFNKEHDSICEVFLKREDPNFVYCNKGGKHWLDWVLYSNSQDLKVAIKDEKGNVHIFHITADRLDPNENRYVVTLTDITEIVQKEKEIEAENVSKGAVIENSCPKFLIEFSKMIGEDIFIKYSVEDIKENLIKNYQQFLTLLEVGEFDEEFSTNAFQEYKKSKDEIVKKLELIDDFFAVNHKVRFNLYEVFEKLANTLQKYEDFPYTIQILGKQDIIIKDNSSSIYRLVMFLYNIFYNISTRLEKKEKDTVKITIEEEKGDVRVSFKTKNNSFCKDFLPNEDKTLSYTPEFREVIQKFISCIEDHYKGKFIVGADKCEIYLPKKVL